MKPCKYCDIKATERKTGTVRYCETDRFRIYEVKKGDALYDDVSKEGFYLDEYEGLQPIYYCPNCGRKLDA